MQTLLSVNRGTFFFFFELSQHTLEEGAEVRVGRAGVFPRPLPFLCCAKIFCDNLKKKETSGSVLLSFYS